MALWASQQCVIEAVLDHTHFLLLYYKLIKHSGRLVLEEELFKETLASWKNIGHKSEVRKVANYHQMETPEHAGGRTKINSDCDQFQI